MYNIRIERSVDVRLPKSSYGDILILNKEPEIKDTISDIARWVLNGLDMSATFYKYSLKVAETETEDFNIVCLIENPANREPYYVVAKADIDELDLAVSEVINAAEAQMRKFYEEALVVVAMDSPAIFRDALNKVIPLKDSLYGRQPFFHHIVARRKPGSALREAALELRGHKAAERGSTGETGSVSARARNEAFDNLPSKLSEAFENQNPVDFEIVKETFRNMTAAEMQAIIFELAKKKAGLLHDMQSTALNAASRYEIHVRPWRSGARNHFKDRYLYCIYLRNAKGLEIPVSFKNYPSYCIYMMYVIDRVQRGDEVTELKVKKNKKAFCELYSTVINETPDNVIKLYEEMDYRKIAGTGKIRKGRYDDYIKDIHETLERLVGDIDSIPLKVGHGRYLGVLPERIFIDERLAKFRFT